MEDDNENVDSGDEVYQPFVSEEAARKDTKPLDYTQVFTPEAPSGYKGPVEPTATGMNDAEMQEQ